MLKAVMRVSLDIKTLAKHHTKALLNLFQQTCNPDILIEIQYIGILPLLDEVKHLAHHPHQVLNTAIALNTLSSTVFCLEWAVDADDGNVLKNVARGVCLNSSTPCSDVDGSIKLVNFALIHLETFALLGEDTA